MHRLHTDELEQILSGTPPEDIGRFLEDNASELILEERAFTSYMRRRFQDHGVKPQEVFDRADLPQRYGYRIISGEKHTKQRDFILRICFAANFTLQETQRALQIYGMSRLYARLPRDAVLILAMTQGITDLKKVNEMLTSHHMPPLKNSGDKEQSQD